MSAKTAAQLLAQFRQTAAPIESAAPRTNTKLPLQEVDQETIRRYLAEHEPEWLGVFYSLSLETGWRTNDVASMEWSAIDFDLGAAHITVQKQTKSAQARALTKGLRTLQAARQAEAMATGDGAAFMKWSTATRDELAAAATPEELEKLSQLVASAPRKTDKKLLSPALLARLAAMRKAAFWTSDDDNYIFSRALTNSNRTKLQSGHHITRSTMWSRMKSVISACAEVLQTATHRLSAYSLRKSFARNMLTKTNNIAQVMELMGHSSIQMTQKYLGLLSEAEQAQAAYVGWEASA